MPEKQTNILEEIIDEVQIIQPDTLMHPLVMALLENRPAIELHMTLNSQPRVEAPRPPKIVARAPSRVDASAPYKFRPGNYYNGSGSTITRMS